MNNIFPGSAYLEYHDSNLFVVSGTGIIGYASAINEDQIVFKQMSNNISDFIR